MDAFAGLAWDDAKVNDPKNATLGAQQKRQLTPLQPSQSSSSNDVFGKLAAAGQFVPSGASSSNPKPTLSTQTISPTPSIPVSRSNRSTPSISNNGDPFGGLFARGGSPNINMSMADRRAHAEREKRDRERREKEKLEAQGAMWDQLDGAFSTNGINTASRTTSPSPATSNVRAYGRAITPVGLKTNPGVKVATSPPSGTDLFWSMHQSPPSASSRTSSPAVIPQKHTVPSRSSSLQQQTDAGQDDLLGFGSTSPKAKVDAWSQLDLLAAPKPARPVNAQPSVGSDPFDLDFLSDPSPVAPSASYQATPPLSRARTPGDFDFNEREAPDSGTVSDDDILGDLAKPVDEVRAASASRTGAVNSQGNGSRPVSPPPHILGQIVEMGFTPEQARLALAATDTGLDVEAALESLLAAGGDVTSPEMRDQPEYPASPPRPRQVPREPVDPGRARASGTSTPSNTSANVQFQADKLLAQASEIGFNMFTKANAFWNQGKEVVQKAYEESRKQTAPGLPTNDGRPRWMQTGTPDLPDTHESAQRQPKSGGFRDDDDVREMDTAPRPQPQRRREPTGPSTSTASPAPQTNDVSLFGDDAPTYVSPHRRRPAPTSSLAGLEAPQPTSRRAAPPPRPEPRTSRINIVIPEASPNAIATSVAARTKGTELFKLGQYAEAEAAYTKAITSLPSNHILLTSLYTNRAAARLKTGDSGGAVGDCTSAFKLMTVEDDMSKLMDINESMTWNFDGVPGKLDLREQAVKALQRRAAGLEGMERWDRARQDWERLSGLQWPQAQGRVKEEATRSAGRCRTMVNSANKAASANDLDPSAASSRPPSRPRPRPVKRPSAPSKPSEAAVRLKQAEAAQEAEENERIQLKDSVDARIHNWKNGKEANLRALIASLDTVLWPELGWVKVGMHELVTPSQVKIRYTKAIAKVHPDKLKTGNTTVEQRMLANGVFAGLNEAWGSFKP
ncbi:hypothetical protein CPB86DRAFT_874043 [Serendipita vermifera]|nr:hypothetical protein CPB86DRAFT_874043 [Serendipita vermifera]